ncbi:MAG: HAD-IA family hydrolase [Bacteroidales bacterium]|nr:HAD-IA family hydrolase [Bacteroidales bacterium]
MKNKFPDGLKAVMFDMDGVIYDSMPNHVISWVETFNAFGLVIPESWAYMQEGRTGESSVQMVFAEQRDRKATKEETEAMYKLKCELFASRPKAEIMPGIRDLFAKVKNSGLAATIVTGSGQRTLLNKLNTDFPGMFQKELLVTAFDVKHGKPNPEPYLKGLGKLNVSAAEAIVIENAPLGIQAACAAGVFTVAVNTGPLPDQVLLDAGASMLFHSLSELSDKWESLF